MDSNGFERAATVVEQSAVAGAGRSAINRLRVAASRSVAARLVANTRATFADVPATERVRLAGVAILTATATQAVLLELVSSMARPHAPWLRVELAALGLMLILAAAPIARAWPRSRIHRVIERFRRPGTHA
jgi:hypothetical protein